jgi:16S rRNA (adenine1518-N6/adenine1519-N6)-dimethyltransferase
VSNPSLTPSALRALAARHGIRPRKSLGQHFLIEPQLARRIADLAGAGPGVRVVEVGAGMGSLTVALADRGADVVAVEVDPRLIPALAEAVGDRERVRVVEADAVDLDWSAVLGSRPATWTMAANLPYNVAVPVVLLALEREPRIARLLVMVQREVGERLAASPGDAQYGAVSAKLRLRATARVVRPVSRSVFWPVPNVDSVLVAIERRPEPLAADPDRVADVIEAAFAERRKTMRNAVRRLGLDLRAAEAVLRAAGVDPSARPEELDAAAFVRLTEALSREAAR